MSSVGLWLRRKTTRRTKTVPVFYQRRMLFDFGAFLISSLKTSTLWSWSPMRWVFVVSCKPSDITQLTQLIMATQVSKFNHIDISSECFFDLRFEAVIKMVSDLWQVVSRLLLKVLLAIMEHGALIVQKCGLASKVQSLVWFPVVCFSQLLPWERPQFQGQSRFDCHYFKNTLSSFIFTHSLHIKHWTKNSVE